MAATTVSIPAYQTCNAAEITDYCIKTKNVKWLKETNRECKKFFQLRKAFYTKFAPEMIPHSAKGKGYRGEIEALPED